MEELEQENAIFAWNITFHDYNYHHYSVDQLINWSTNLVSSSMIEVIQKSKATYTQEIKAYDDFVVKIGRMDQMFVWPQRSFDILHSSRRDSEWLQSPRMNS